MTCRSVLAVLAVSLLTAATLAWELDGSHLGPVAPEADVEARTASTQALYEEAGLIDLMTAPEPFGAFTFHLTFRVCGGSTVVGPRGSQSEEEGVTRRDETEFLFELARLHPSDDVLDYGCGVGGTAMRLAAMQVVRSVRGATPSTGQLRRARTEARHRGLQDEVAFVSLDTTTTTTATLAAASADVLLAQESSSQVHDKAGMFAEWRRILRPGGRFALQDFFQRPPRVEPLASSVELAWRTTLVAPETLESYARAAGFVEVQFVDGLAVSCLVPQATGHSLPSLVEQFAGGRHPVVDALLNGSFAVGFLTGLLPRTPPPADEGRRPAGDAG